MTTHPFTAEEVLHRYWVQGPDGSCWAEADTWEGAVAARACLCNEHQLEPGRFTLHETRPDPRRVKVVS